MTAGEVITDYHSLWHVKQSSRMSKHDLHARPIFPRQAIEAHLTVVTASLAIAHHLQAQTGVSIKKIIRPLRALQEATITTAKHTHHAHDSITDQAKTTLTKWDCLNSGVWGSGLV